MSIRSRRTLTAFVAATTLVAGIVTVAPTPGYAEESDTRDSTIAKIDANLNSLNTQAEELGGQVTGLNAEIGELEAEYQKLVPEKERKQALLNETIKESYVTGDESAVEVLASEATFSEVVSKQHYHEEIQVKTDRAAQELEEITQQIEEKLGAAKEKRQGLLTLKGQLDERIATAEAQEEAKRAAEALSEEQFQQAQEANTQTQAEGIAQSSPSSSPGSGSPQQISGGNNPYPWGQCTWYVYQATGRGQNGNAGSWGGGSSGGPGSILIMPPGVNGAGSAGHVGVVVSVSGSGVTIRDSNWFGLGVISTHTVPKSSSYRYF